MRVAGGKAGTGDVGHDQAIVQREKGIVGRDGFWFCYIEGGVGDLCISEGHCRGRVGPRRGHGPC